MFGKRDEVNIEVTLHLKVKRNLWRAFIKPRRKCKIGEIIVFKNNLNAKLIEKFVQGDVLLQFNKCDQSLLNEVYLQGEMPLPPYIKREIKSDNDKENLNGVITDGDIRRALIDKSNFSELKAADLMNKNPLTALETDNLQLAENRMREAKVQCLIVKNKINDVVGVIQIFE